MSDEIWQAAWDALGACDCGLPAGLRADAVIAALTPLIRRQALAEAESAIDSFKLDRSGGVVDAPREIIRDLANPNWAAELMGVDCERCVVSRPARFTVAGRYRVCGAHVEWALWSTSVGQFFAPALTPPAAADRVNG